MPSHAPQERNSEQTRGVFHRALVQSFLFLITVYQYCLSPFLGTHCRFYPGCSSYTKEAIQRHGAAKGLFLGTRRICSCHPFHEGGHDPVPDSFSFFKQKN